MPRTSLVDNPSFNLELKLKYIKELDFQWK